MYINKNYYNQRDIISEIKAETGFSVYQIERVLEALEETIQEKFSETKNDVEVKLFPGVSLTMEHIPAQYSNLCDGGSIPNKPMIHLDVKYSDWFKRKIRKNRLLQKEGEVNSSDQ